jgi:hypothetical protein
MTRATLLGVFGLMASLAVSGMAQDRTGSITGTVHDPSGAPVPDAQITVRNRETGIKRVTKTSGNGDYTVTLLDPGSYDAVVEHAGFKSLQRSGIELHVNDSLRIDYALALGEVSQVVDVHEETPLLRTNDASLGQVVDNQKVTSLPLNGRSSFRLVELTPGYTPSPGANGQFGDIPVNTTWDSNFSINGGQGYSNEIMIDGTPSTTGFFDQITTMPSVDALEEFKVQSNAMSAEFGRTGGGVLNVTTKSGTNAFHGSLFEFLRNSVLGANDYFNNLAGSPRVAFKMNQFGGSIGGPVVKNRTFFFFNYEGTRWRRGAVFVTTVPTAAERQGDFSHDVTNAGQLIAIYDPTSTVPAAQAGQYVRTPFPGNIIPANRINQIGANIASYYPLPNTVGSGASGVNNYVSNAGGAVNKDQFNGRLDHQITANDKIFGRISSDVTDLCQPNTYGNIASPGAASVGCTTFKNRSASLEDDYTISPNVLFSIRYGFARWYQIRAGLSYGFNQTTLGFPAALVSEEQIPAFPTVNVSGYGALGNQGSNYLSNGNDTHSLLPSLTIVRGRQVIKAGADMRMTRINLFNPNSPGGVYGFTQAFTQGPNPLTSSATAGDAFASMLLGTPASGSVTTDVGVSMQSFYFAGYVQDEIKATDKLTISAGLRYETESPYTERHNKIVGFDANLPSPAANAAFPNLQGGLVFASPGNRYVYDWYKKGFGPRLGLAYQAAKHTVIRAGAGMFYAPLQISNSAVGFSPSSGFSSTTPLTASIDGGLTPFNSLANAFSSGLIPPSGNSLGASTFLGQGITVWDSHPITPRSYQWNFDIQHQLPWSVLIDAAYVGNRGVFLAGNRQFDAMPTQYLALGSALLNQVPNPFYGKITTGTLAQPTVTAQSLITPFPQFSSVNVINDTAGNSMYHAFQLKVEKRLSSGLSVLVAYSFEKIITDVPWAASGIGGNNGSGTYQNWYNLSAERALSAQDVPNSLTISYNYALPFGKGKTFGGQWHGPMEWILGNWALNGITRVNSGNPLALATSVNNTHSLGGGSRPNTNGVNSALSNPNIYGWFNVGTFSAPAAFTLGNVSRTINVFSPGVVNFDASVFKNLVFRERYTLQFRAEFFNLFNHENFAPPDTTLGDKTFGQISASNLLPRVGQLALKLTF